MTKLSELDSVNGFIDDVLSRLEAEKLPVGEMFSRCLKSNLDLSARKSEDGSIFLVTGDIPAMWLRDSACQIRPFLYLAGQEEKISDFVEGVIKRQIANILIDPYANAFNETANGNCWEHDLTDMKPELWERKFEIDSLCFPFQIAYLYWKATKRTTVFTEDFKEAAKRVLEVFTIERDHEHRSAYTFQRKNCVFTDTLSRDGKGALVKSNCGLIWSGFRPSDDACVYGYLIPSNMFAVVILEYLSEIFTDVYQEPDLAEELKAFADSVREAIEREALVPVGGERFDKTFYAYEVDGFGQYNIMDDANVPSLLAIPYIGYADADSELYRNTKEIILSEQNPYYYKGTKAKGIGSPHTKSEYIWHISLGMQGLTAKTKEEKRAFIEQMAALDAGTGWMHESIYVNDPSRFTRPLFGWANAVFAELVLDFCGYSL